MGFERLEDRRQLAGDGDGDDQITEHLSRLTPLPRQLQPRIRLASGRDVDMFIIDAEQGERWSSISTALIMV